MNRALSMIAVSSVFITHTAHAARGGDEGTSNPVIDALLGFLPIVLFIGILIFFYRHQRKSPVAKLQQQSLERHIQHMQHMEELLERIATAIEKNNETKGA